MYFLRDRTKEDSGFIEKNIQDLCASIQHTIVSYLMQKLNLALEGVKVRSIGIAGGVAANTGLRLAVKELAKANDLPVYIPEFEYCTDNAAMIAKAGAVKFEKQRIWHTY